MPAPGVNVSQTVTGFKPAVVQTTAPTPPAALTSESTQASAFDIKLPAGCGFVKGSGTTTVAVCQAPSEPLWEKLVVSAPSLLFSLVAIFISLRTFGYNRRKDLHSRSQSIQDDFWIRKIISPISVEPFLKYTTELSASLPKATSTTDSQVELFWTQQISKIGEFSLSFRTLGLVNAQLDADVAKKLEEFEDCLADYCGRLRQNLAGTMAQPPDRGEFTRAFVSITIEILKHIQAHQASVGNAEPTL